jgi:hypothetical protein
VPNSLLGAQQACGVAKNATRSIPNPRLRSETRTKISNRSYQDNRWVKNRIADYPPLPLFPPPARENFRSYLLLEKPSVNGGMPLNSTEPRWVLI